MGLMPHLQTEFTVVATMGKYNQKKKEELTAGDHPAHTVSGKDSLGVITVGEQIIKAILQKIQRKWKHNKVKYRLPQINHFL